MAQIRADLKDCDLWVSVDETTDQMGRTAANVLVGKLSSTKSHPPYLVECTFLEKTDSGHIAHLVNHALQILGEVDPDYFKLFLTDMAAYMVKCGSDLSISYPCLIHLTCIALDLHPRCHYCFGEAWPDSCRCFQHFKFS